LNLRGIKCTMGECEIVETGQQILIAVMRNGDIVLFRLALGLLAENRALRPIKLAAKIKFQLTAGGFILINFDVLLIESP